MPQSAEKILDHEKLFREPEYKTLFAKKKQDFEFGHSAAKVQEVCDWTRSLDYQEKNFARDALTVNPAKACQPLGAVFAAVGFQKTLPFVHGSQGCVAYRSEEHTSELQSPCNLV